MPGAGLKTLAHHIDVDWLREAYRRTRKDGARGVDGQSAEQYAEHLEDNLRALLERAKSGMYRAPPVRRVHIPKGDGSQTRPIGIPTFEDKVLQRAVAMLLEAVYEQEFHDFSYGFRPGRSAHQACEALQNATVRMAGGWVLEVDIAKFFDTLDHAQLRDILRRRVRDGVVLRLIGKWLNAGVLEGVELSHPESGTPQGGVISPLLANIYLHEVLDELSRALRRVRVWCREHRHWRVKEQHRILAQKVRGHYAYYGVTSNYAALRADATPEVSQEDTKTRGSGDHGTTFLSSRLPVIPLGRVRSARKPIVRHLLSSRGARPRCRRHGLAPTPCVKVVA